MGLKTTRTLTKVLFIIGFVIIVIKTGIIGLFLAFGFGTWLLHKILNKAIDSVVHSGRSFGTEQPAIITTSLDKKQASEAVRQYIALDQAGENYLANPRVTSQENESITMAYFHYTMRVTFQTEKC